MSCAAILGFERLSEEGAVDPLAESGSDSPIVSGDGGSDAPSPSVCNDIGYPNPPTNTAPGLVAPLIGALRLLDFGIDVDGGRPQIPGYNLDRTCSTDLATSSCVSSLLPATFETHAKDKNAAGVDNAGFSLIEYISRFSDVLSAKGINDGIAIGKYGAVVRLDGWNGQPDDDAVQLDIFPAIGFEPRDGGAVTTPVFDENDVWTLDSRFQVGGFLEASTIKSDTAWIANKRLVARFKEVTLMIAIDDDPKLFEIHIVDAVLTATVGVDHKGKQALVDGVVAGRWATSDFLGQVRTIYIKDSTGVKNTFLCESAAQLIYKSVKDVICDGRDIRGDSQDSKNLPCNAVSAGARLESYSVKQLGVFEAAPDAGKRCIDASAVPAGDDCPP